ncbi:hypothetical protein [Salinarchaeum sp. Harcht-Bsk1]|uniref:hypothetical protein n=1 Tax=Salinarchaeum sp. Harcht-Bsk1 TaxID=1333523 RepID=UPI0011817EC1|nr:hypothetical protein [Salinarchaeum sp. Harcht-Bsk1]
MSSGELLVINIMRTPNTGSGAWDIMFDYVSIELERIYNNSSIDGYIARKYDTTYDPGCATRELMGEDALNWLDDENLNAPGSYVFLNDVCTYGDSDMFAWGGSSWKEPTVAFVAEHARQPHGLGVQAIHEGLHNYLHTDECSVVINQILDGDTGCSSSEDHNLGTAHTSYWGDEATPMLGWYGQCEATAGNCSDWAWTTDKITECSSCTVEALEASAAHDAGQH